MKNNLKRIREKRGLSVDALATMSEVDKNIILSIENQKTIVVTNAIIINLAKALNSTIDEIFFANYV